MALVGAASVAAMVVLAAGTSLAAGVSPPVAPALQPDSPHRLAIPQGTFLYKFAWNGIPSAESEVVVSVEDEESRPHYRFRGTARTSKFVDIFWRFRAHAVAVVDALTGRARKIDVDEQQNRKLKKTETVFDYESSEAHYTRWKKGKAKQKTICLDGNTIDPVCLGLIICQQPLKVGDSAAFTVLVGDDPYALEYSVTARDRISAADREFDALRIEPRFHKIEDEKKNKAPKVRQMTLWLSESEPRIPLRMRTKTFIGHVTGELVQTLPGEPELPNDSASAS
jgi:hypothetical protein